MDLEQLGYYLYMESCELEDKRPEELTEDEKFNVEINPFLVAEKATTNQN